VTALLVTGLARSGTSFVGKMVEAGGGVVYVNEPLNPGHPPGRSPGVLDHAVTHQYQYIGEGDAGWRRAFTRTLALRYGFGRELRRNHRPYDLARLVKYGTSFTVGRLRGRRAMLDDPFALFATPWLVRTFGVRTVVLVRDPVAVAGSYRRLGWRMRFEQLLDQPGLVRDLLGPHTGEVREAAGETDPLRAYALMWRVAYGIVDRHYRDLPGVAIRRYEDFATDPAGAFAELYDHFGLRFTDRAATRIAKATGGTGTDRDAHRWTLAFGLSKTAFRPLDSASMLASAHRRLAPEEIATVRELTKDVAERFYPATVRAR
jgi:hypothetical protein